MHRGGVVRPNNIPSDGGGSAWYQIVLDQRGSFLDWFAFKQPLGLLIFFIAATAEANRTPFDLTEADSEIVAGFATEYSGMRFGFFFFAEYVNVFIMSALIVSLFFGGWTAPFDWPWPVHIELNPGGLGIGLLILLAVAPVVGTLVLAAPFWVARSSMPAWQALIIGFVLLNLLIGLGLFALAFLGWEWVVGLFWFLSRGGVDVYFPDDIKTRFADVWGQDHVLAKVKEGAALTNGEDDVKRRGLVLILKELHDNIDRLTSQAYGWRADLTE